MVIWIKSIEVMWTKIYLLDTGWVELHGFFFFSQIIRVVETYRKSCYTSLSEKLFYDNLMNFDNIFFLLVLMNIGTIRNFEHDSTILRFKVSS